MRTKFTEFWTWSVVRVPSENNASLLISRSLKLAMHAETGWMFRDSNNACVFLSRSFKHTGQAGPGKGFGRAGKDSVT